MGNFYEFIDSRAFAPICVAFAALILTFTNFGVDSTFWLDSLLQECLLSLHVSEETKIRSDINECLVTFQNVINCEYEFVEPKLVQSTSTGKAVSDEGMNLKQFSGNYDSHRASPTNVFRVHDNI